MEDADGTPPVSGEGNIAGTETTMAEQDASSGKWVVKDGRCRTRMAHAEKVSVTFMNKRQTAGRYGRERRKRYGSESGSRGRLVS